MGSLKNMNESTKRSKRSTGYQAAAVLNGDNSDREEKEELIPELVSFVVSVVRSFAQERSEKLCF